MTHHGLPVQQRCLEYPGDTCGTASIDQPVCTTGHRGTIMTGPQSTQKLKNPFGCGVCAPHARELQSARRLKRLGSRYLVVGNGNRHGGSTGSRKFIERLPRGRNGEVGLQHRIANSPCASRFLDNVHLGVRVGGMCCSGEHHTHASRIRPPGYYEQTLDGLTTHMGRNVHKLITQQLVARAQQIFALIATGIIECSGSRIRIHHYSGWIRHTHSVIKIGGKRHFPCHRLIGLAIGNIRVHYGHVCVGNNR